MSKQLKHSPGEPTLFAQTVARDILKQAREMDAADSSGTRFSVSVDHSACPTIYKQRQTGGNEAYVVEGSSSSRVQLIFDKPGPAIDCVLAITATGLASHNEYASKKTVYVELRARDFSSDTGVVVTMFAPTRMPPYSYSEEAIKMHKGFHETMQDLLASPPRYCVKPKAKKAKKAREE